MSQKILLDYTLARYLAIEQQLLAEEKFVVDALMKIKKQRNSLQIERLHLTSELGKLVMKKKGTSEPAQDKDSSTEEIQLTESKGDPLAFSMDDEVCNAEELNLTVPEHTFDNYQANTQMEDIEEFENAEADDYEIDMNMLMNGELE